MELAAAIGALEQHNIGQMKSPNTIEFYNQRLAKMEEFFGPDADLTEIEQEHLRKFIATLPAQYSDETVRATVVAIKRLFSLAEGEGKLERNPATNIPLPRVRKQDKHALRPSEIHGLLDAFQNGTTGDRWRAMLLVALDTGLRVSELCALRLDDVEGHRVRVHRGKGHKPRTVFMGDRAARALDTYLRQRPAAVDSTWIWVNRNGHRVTGHDFRKALYRAGEKAGVKVYPHKLRRTFATMMLQNGADLFTLQELMGHEDISTTRRYVEINEAQLQRVHSKAGPVDLM